MRALESNPVTVMMPVYNRTKYFEEALVSVLSQTIPVRVIVVDNASDRADFGSILRRYDPERVQLVRNPSNLGMIGNWNRCLELCPTRYALILHDDDRLRPYFLERMVAELSEGTGLVWCRAEVIDADGKCLIAAVPEGGGDMTDLDRWSFSNLVAAPSAVVDVQRALEIGGFRARLRYTPDWDLWFRLRLAYPVKFVDFVGVDYRTYQSDDRGTSTLEKSRGFLFFVINQQKRNAIVNMGRSEYLRRIRQGEIPRPSMNVILNYFVRMTPKQRRYFARRCALGPKNTMKDLLRSVGFTIMGCRLLAALFWIRSLRK